MGGRTARHVGRPTPAKAPGVEPSLRRRPNSRDPQDGPGAQGHDRPGAVTCRQRTHKRPKCCRTWVEFWQNLTTFGKTWQKFWQSAGQMPQVVDVGPNLAERGAQDARKSASKATVGQLSEQLLISQISPHSPEVDSKMQRSTTVGQLARGDLHRHSSAKM